MEVGASNDHLTLDLLRQVQAGERSASELASLALAHLLGLCPDCRRVFDAWRSDGMTYMAAIVGKSLSALYARQGRFAELEVLTREIVTAFEDLQVYPEADAARKILEEATGAGSPPVH